SNIPRLDPVREILRHVSTPFAPGAGSPGPSGPAIPLGSRILHVVLDLEALECQEMARGTALGTLRARRGVYDPAIVEAAANLPAHVLTGALQERRIGELRSGMVFARDVLLDGSSLLIARNQEVTPGVVMRLRNFAEAGRIQEPIAVYVLV